MTKATPQELEAIADDLDSFVNDMMEDGNDASAAWLERHSKKIRQIATLARDPGGEIKSSDGGVESRRHAATGNMSGAAPEAEQSSPATSFVRTSGPEDKALKPRAGVAPSPSEATQPEPEAVMHSNPFTDYGHDIRSLQNDIRQKADNYEVSSLRSTLDRLERSVDMGRDEHRREVDGLRARIEELEERLMQLAAEVHAVPSAPPQDVVEGIARIIDPHSFNIRDESGGVLCTVECKDAIAKATAILASGLVTVLSEATDAMVKAAHGAKIFLNMTDEGWRKAWRVMAAASGLVTAAGEGAVADQIIGQIEERFPNWRSFRDLIDCIDVTLHQLRSYQVAHPEEAAIRADEREWCAQEAFTAVTHVVIPDDGNTTLADHVAAAIRNGGK